MIFFLKKLLHIGDQAYRYDQIFNEIKRIRPLNIMEIGVWTGDKALQMINIAKKYHDAKDINYFGFDLFEVMDEDKFKKEISKQPLGIEEIQSKLDKAGSVVKLYKGDTTVTLPNLVDKLPKMDIIFIDGGHSLETISNDWLYSSKLMGQDTVVIFDDYWPNRLDAGAKSIVDNIDRNIYEVSILPTTDFFKETPFGPLTIQLAMVKLKKV